mmetsp:Transcript_98329/g.194863  ORF Transcript_98329/g.194863 Transcript_98329/m.194863 type:complete len:229 (+) Transcript_98329:876-1562(+)
MAVAALLSRTESDWQVVLSCEDLAACNKQGCSVTLPSQSMLLTLTRQYTTGAARPQSGGGHPTTDGSPTLAGSASAWVLEDHQDLAFECLGSEGSLEEARDRFSAYLQNSGSLGGTNSKCPRASSSPVVKPAGWHHTPLECCATGGKRPTRNMILGSASAGVILKSQNSWKCVGTSHLCVSQHTAHLFWSTVHSLWTSHPMLGISHLTFGVAHAVALPIRGLQGAGAP